LNHLLTLAESHIETVVLAKFIEAVEKYVFYLSCTISFSALFALIGCIISLAVLQQDFNGTNSINIFGVI
jgi:hypothetical protein